MINCNKCNGTPKDRIFQDGVKMKVEIYCECGNSVYESFKSIAAKELVNVVDRLKEKWNDTNEFIDKTIIPTPELKDFVLDELCFEDLCDCCRHYNRKLYIETDYSCFQEKHDLCKNGSCFSFDVESLGRHTESILRIAELIKENDKKEKDD